jgi:hypothetical protein
MTAITATTDLSSIISKAAARAAKVERSRFDEQISGSQLTAAENRISSAESQVQRSETEKQSIQDKLSPPPTKEVSGQGKKGTGTKTVVDEREKSRLEASLRATDVQLSQAQSAVEAARAEATELRGQALGSAGVSQEQQRLMSSLLEQISGLKTSANDAQTDVTSTGFQNRLNKSIEDAEQLARELPESGDATLKKFWEDVENGFKDIQRGITTSLTPRPADLKTSDNYAGFFEDIDQGYGAIMNHLEGLGVDRAVLGEVRNSRDSIANQRNTYLAGMNESDNLIIQNHLTDINVMIAKINNGESLSNSDLAGLSQGALRSSTVLGKGGSAFEDVIKIPFNTIALNMNALNSRVDDESFKDFFELLTNIYDHPRNNYSGLVGIKKDEVERLYNFSDLVTELKDKSDISSSDIENLVSEGNGILEMLRTRYGFSTDNPGTGANNGGAGSTGNSRVATRPDNRR